MNWSAFWLGFTVGTVATLAVIVVGFWLLLWLEDRLWSDMQRSEG